MYLFSGLAGHDVLGPVLERRPHGMQAGDELAVGAQDVEGALPHPGHDPHVDRHVGRVGELHADVALVRAQRAHGERDDVHRAPPHRASEQALERLPHLGGIAPVVRRAGVVLVPGADERAVLHARDVARVRPGEVRVRPLGVREPLEGPGVDQELAEPVVLLRGAVAPETSSGWVRAAACSTQLTSFSFFVGTVVELTGVTLLRVGCGTGIMRSRGCPTRRSLERG